MQALSLKDTFRIRPVFRSARSIVAGLVTVALAACGGGGAGGGGGGGGGGTPPPAAATVTALSPASVVAGSGAFTLTVDGTGFVAASLVKVDATVLPTTFVSATRLTASVPAAVVATAGALAVTVVDGGGAASNAINVTVAAAPPAPLAIASLSPDTLSAGSAAFTLTVSGTGFTSASQVRFAGTLLATTFVDSTRLSAAAPALVTASTLPVQVVDGARSTSSLDFHVIADAFPDIVSRSPSSAPLGGNHESTIAAPDAQGRFVAFQSAATDLVAGDLGNGVFTSIYLRDTCVGAAAACTASTRLVSINAAGTQCIAPAGSLGSMNPVISADGRFVAFLTDACFASIAQHPRQIALRDTCVTASGPVAGCTASTTLVSANLAGQPSASNLSSLPAPALSRNGRYVAWTSVASDLVGGVASGGFLQLYLRDRCVTSAGAVAGCAPQTLLVSGIVGAAANYDASQGFVAVSDNGIVVFATSASNLVANPGLTPGSGGAVFRAECSGGVPVCALSIVTIVPGTGPAGTGLLVQSEMPAISTDGRFIAFLSQGGDANGHLVTALPPNLPPPTLQLPGRQIMRYDSCMASNAFVPACAPGFSYESVLDNGNLDTTLLSQASTPPSISDAGRFVSFAAPYNLSPLYPGGGYSVYVRDTCAGAPAGCVPHIALVSVDANHVAAGTVGWSRISGDGHFVVFYSVSRSPPNASNLLPSGQVIMVRTGF
jgi:trimeric autotransporter adhesin